MTPNRLRMWALAEAVRRHLSDDQKRVLLTLVQSVVVRTDAHTCDLEDGDFDHVDKLEDMGLLRSGWSGPVDYVELLAS